MENLRWLDFVIVFLYFALVAWIGFRFSRRQNSTDTYFAARRAVPHWAMGLSMFATLISSITFIAYPGSAHAGNWSELVPGFMVIGVLLLVGTVLVPFYRQAVGLSAYEYFGQRFGYGARAYSGLAFSAGHFAKMGFVFYLISLTASSMTGLNIYVVLLIAGVVTVLYTLFGGLEAVIWTDVLQGFIMFIGVIVILGFLVHLMPGGIGAAFDLANEKGKFSLGTPKPGFRRQDQPVGDVALRLLLVSAEVCRRSDHRAALSGGEVRPRSAQGRGARGTAVRAVLDDLHAHRHARVGLLPALRHGLPARVAGQDRQGDVRQGLPALSGDPNPGRPGGLVHRGGVGGGHVHAVLRSQLPLRRGRGRLLSQAAAERLRRAPAVS
jgi:hypothetical protein